MKEQRKTETHYKDEKLRFRGRFGIRPETKVSERHRQFIAEYLRNGCNGTQAYMKIYNNKNSNSSQVSSGELLKKPHIIEEIKRQQGPLNRIAIRIGINDQYAFEKVKKLMEATKQILNKDGDTIGEVDDFSAIAKGVELWAKLLGKFEKETLVLEEAESKDYSKMTNEELTAEKKKILDRLRGLQTEV